MAIETLVFGSNKGVNEFLRNFIVGNGVAFFFTKLGNENIVLTVDFEGCLVVNVF